MPVNGKAGPLEKKAGPLEKKPGLREKRMNSPRLQAAKSPCGAGIGCAVLDIPIHRCYDANTDATGSIRRPAIAPLLSGIG